MTRALRLLGLLSRFVGLVGLASIAACAGNEGNASGRPPRGDWRHQSAACTTDDQCNGGACVIADGATRGTCAGGPGTGADPSLPPGHPPRRPGGPNGPGEEPTVKPQPGDIQL